MALQHIRVGIVGLAAGAMLLTACSSGTSSGSSASQETDHSAAASSSSAAGLDAVAGEAAAFAALSPADQGTRLAAESSAAELALLPATDATAYNAVAAALVTQARAYAADPSFGKSGAGPVRAQDGGYGGMLFASWLLAGIGMSAAVGGSNSAEAGAPAQSDTKKESSKNVTSEMTFSGSVEKASMDMTMTSTENGMTGSLHVKGTVNPCPDVGGLFKAKVTMDASGISSSSGGSLSSTVDISLQGLVNDNADIIGYETTTNTKAKSAARGQIADVSSTTTYVGGDVTAATRGPNTAAAGSALDGGQWANLGMMTEMTVVQNLMDAIKKAIESGRCVKLNAPTTPAKTKGLKPSTTVSISAQPRSKIDGKPTGGTVTGKLNGGSSLDPTGTQVNADATFTYVAPDKEDDRATVTLEARSMRGVGKAEVPADTVQQRGWVLGGAKGPYQFFGKSCGSAAGPWEITYTLEGIPQLKGGGVIKLTFPSELDPRDDGNSVKTTGTDKGEIKAVGLPGGVRFNGPADATLTAWNSKFKMKITVSGMATGYARDKQRTQAEHSDTVEFVVTAAGPDSCPTQ